MNLPPSPPPSPDKRPKAKRGFAAMDPALQREIASRGGASAHRSGRAHRFTSEEARAAVAKKTGKAAPDDGEQST